MSFIVVSIPHAGTHALVAMMGAATSDFRGQWDRQGQAYTFNPGHPPFWGHPETPYIEWLIAAPYVLLTPVRPLTDIARSWIMRAGTTETQRETIDRLVQYLEWMRAVAARRALVPVDMRLIPRAPAREGTAATLTDETLARLTTHAHDLLHTGLDWPVNGEPRAHYTTAA